MLRHREKRKVGAMARTGQTRGVVRVSPSVGRFEGWRCRIRRRGPHVRSPVLHHPQGQRIHLLARKHSNEHTIRFALATDRARAYKIRTTLQLCAPQPFLSFVPFFLPSAANDKWTATLEIRKHSYHGRCIFLINELRRFLGLCHIGFLCKLRWMMCHSWPGTPIRRITIGIKWTKLMSKPDHFYFWRRLPASAAATSENYIVDTRTEPTNSGSSFGLKEEKKLPAVQLMSQRTFIQRPSYEHRCRSRTSSKAHKYGWGSTFGTTKCIERPILWNFEISNIICLNYSNTQNIW